MYCIYYYLSYLEDKNVILDKPKNYMFNKIESLKGKRKSLLEVKRLFLIFIINF